MDEKIKKQEEIINDEAILDKEIVDSVESLKAGKAVGQMDPANPALSVPIEKKEEEIKVSEAPAEPQPIVEKKEGDYDFRVPNKGKFESDESYEKRIELLDLVKKRKLSKTEEQREEFTEQIRTKKDEIRSLNVKNKINSTDNPENNEEEDGALKADKERFKQLGGVTKDDIESLMKQERHNVNVKDTLDKFVERHIDLKDDDVREVFFDFVEDNFNWQNKSGKELMTVLEIARESMFKPSETIQERVINAAGVQKKVDAMQFPGGTMEKGGDSPEKSQSIKELISTGMSEEKARALLSDD
jgi:hypothetical protein